MDVDGGDHDEQDEAERHERRVLAARQPTELERQREQEHSTRDRQSRNWQSKNRMDPESTQTSSACLRQELREFEGSSTRVTENQR